MHAWGHPIKKISIAQFWTEFITLTSSLWQPSPIESTFLCFWGQKYGSCSERHLVSRRLEGGQRWRVQILHLPHSASKMPRVHRIVMDYVQGLKSVSRAKISWQRAGGGRRGGENGLHMTTVAVLLKAGCDCGGSSRHHVTTPPPAMPHDEAGWVILLTAQSRCGRPSSEIRMKRQVAFSPPSVPKVVPCCCDKYERQGCIFVSRHYEFKISQTLLLLRISQTSKFRLTQC